MDTSSQSQLPGGVEFDNNLERILVSAMSYDLDDEGEASRYDINDEEHDLFMPPLGHATGARDLIPYSDEFERARASLEELYRRIDRLEEENRAMRRLIRMIGVEAYAYGSGGGRTVPESSAASALSLETYKYGGAGAAVSGSGGGCVICIEDFQVGDNVSVVPCEYRHCFHRSCIEEWLAYGRACPLYRHEIIPAASIYAATPL